jgi:hypothetical protein
MRLTRVRNAVLLLLRTAGMVAGLAGQAPGPAVKRCASISGTTVTLTWQPGGAPWTSYISWMLSPKVSHEKRNANL